MSNNRLGRFLSPDPYGQYYSAYAGMGNNPVNTIDPSGGYTRGWNIQTSEWVSGSMPMFGEPNWYLEHYNISVYINYGSGPSNADSGFSPPSFGSGGGGQHAYGFSRGGGSNGGGGSIYTGPNYWLKPENKPNEYLTPDRDVTFTNSLESQIHLQDITSTANNLVFLNSLSLSYSQSQIVRTGLFTNRLTMWKGTNGKWYNMSWQGNQWTGGRSVVTNEFNSLSRTSRNLFLIGTGFSIYEGYTNLKDRDFGAAAMNGVDIAMSAVGTFGGVFGMGASMIYFTFRIIASSTTPCVNAYVPTPAHAIQDNTAQPLMPAFEVRSELDKKYNYYPLGLNIYP